MIGIDCFVHHRQNCTVISGDHILILVRDWTSVRRRHGVGNHDVSDVNFINSERDTIATDAFSHIF